MGAAVVMRAACLAAAALAVRTPRWMERMDRAGVGAAAQMAAPAAGRVAMVASTAALAAAEPLQPPPEERVPAPKALSLSPIRPL